MILPVISLSFVTIPLIYTMNIQRACEAALDIGHHWIRREKWGYRKVRVVALPYGLTADNQLTTLTYFCAPAANNHAAATDSTAGYGNGLAIDQYR